MIFLLTELWILMQRLCYKIYSHQTLKVVEKHVDGERLVLPYTSRSLTECFTFLNINLKSQHLWLLPILWNKRSMSLFSHLETCEMCQCTSTTRQSSFLLKKMGLCPNSLLAKNIGSIPEWYLCIIWLSAGWNGLRRKCVNFTEETSGERSNPTFTAQEFCVLTELKEAY